ncbi:DUF1707 domain-containing protein [Actinoallomurus sp. NPDC050550]|uniref:DUF1707 SHOCT-like domain-containing protein n=1 Tax=Actinoallomurus sp. NPDC050550 TaxID=3154937 RepID=UPI0033ECB757
MELPWKPNEQHVPARDLRASDADRERVVELLRDAHGDGRLTVDEHAERVEGAYTARTLGELAELTADLIPAEQQPIQIEHRPLIALFGTVRRGGRWVVPVSLPVSALFGTVEIDLREALLQRRHVVVRAAMFGGRLRLVVPEGVRVEFTGRSVLGSRDLRVRAPYADDAPVVEVSGVVVLGSVGARTPKQRRRWRVTRRRP